MKIVLVEDLVAHVPGVDLALGPAHDGRDVVHDRSDHRRTVHDVRDPYRELRVPDHGVAADELVVRCGVVDELVGAAEGELVLGRFGGVPFHAVLGCD